MDKNVVDWFEISVKDMERAKNFIVPFLDVN